MKPPEHLQSIWDIALFLAPKSPILLNSCQILIKHCFLVVKLKQEIFRNFPTQFMQR